MKRIVLLCTVLLLVASMFVMGANRVSAAADLSENSVESVAILADASSANADLQPEAPQTGDLALVITTITLLATVGIVICARMRNSDH